MASQSDYEDTLDEMNNDNATPSPNTQEPGEFNTTDLKAALSQKIKRNPGSNLAVFERYYKLAIEEARKSKPRVTPNLSKKRPRPLSNSDESSDTLTSSTQPHEDWSTPKKFSRAGKAQYNTHTSTDCTQNRFTPLASQASDAMLTDHRQQHSTDGTFTVPANARHERHTSTGDTLPADQASLPHRKGRAVNTATATGPSQPTPPPSSHDAPTQPKPSARNRPPPIYTRDTRLDYFISLLKEKNIDKKTVTVRQIDVDNLTVHATDLDTYYMILDICKTNNIKSYTFTPKSKKLKNIVLKGLRGNFTPDDIKKELDDLEMPQVSIHKINKVIFNRNNPNNYHFLVQLTPDSNLHELTKIKAISYQSISWEPLKKKSIYQCTKCQRLGHSSSNCNLGYRCVKCNEKHEPGQCKTPKDSPDKNKLFCVNCETAGHPASYKGCIYFKFATALKNDNANQRRTAQSKNINKITNYVTVQGGPPNTNVTDHRNKPTIRTTATHATTSQRPLPSYPTSNAWSSNRDTSRHLFPQQTQHTPDDTALSAIIDQITHQLMAVISNQLNNLQRTLENNTIRINHIFDVLNIDNGDD